MSSIGEASIQSDPRFTENIGGAQLLVARKYWGGATYPCAPSVSMALKISNKSSFLPVEVVLDVFSFVTNGDDGGVSDGDVIHVLLHKGLGNLHM